MVYVSYILQYCGRFVNKLQIAKQIWHTVKAEWTNNDRIQVVAYNYCNMLCLLNKVQQNIRSLSVCVFVFLMKHFIHCDYHEEHFKVSEF